MPIKSFIAAGGLTFFALMLSHNRCASEGVFVEMSFMDEGVLRFPNIFRRSNHLGTKDALNAGLSNTTFAWSWAEYGSFWLLYQTASANWHTAVDRGMRAFSKNEMMAFLSNEGAGN